VSSRDYPGRLIERSSIFGTCGCYHYLILALAGTSRDSPNDRALLFVRYIYDGVGLQVAPDRQPPALKSVAGSPLRHRGGPLLMSAPNQRLVALTTSGSGDGRSATNSDDDGDGDTRNDDSDGDTRSNKPSNENPSR
jgi:hypothetical protein